MACLTRLALTRADSMMARSHRAPHQSPEIRMQSDLLPGFATGELERCSRCPATAKEDYELAVTFPIDGGVQIRLLCGP